jgi:hypothetical protein
MQRFVHIDIALALPASAVEPNNSLSVATRFRYRNDIGDRSRKGIGMHFATLTRIFHKAHRQNVQPAGGMTESPALRMRGAKRSHVAFAVGAAIVLSAWSNGAFAQGLPKYEVAGFRDAHFGMSEQEVRAVVSKSLGVKPADITSAVNAVEGTTVLTVHVASLDPGPGPAEIAYILGYASKKLIQVNVIWGDDAASKADKSDPNTMIAAGTRLERYFAGFTWNKDTTRAGIPVGPNTIVLFSGEDDKKGAVRLVLDGVKYQMEREGKETTSPEPKGPPKLLINYIADRDSPDVAKIDKGKF